MQRGQRHGLHDDFPPGRLGTSNVGVAGVALLLLFLLTLIAACAGGPGGGHGPGGARGNAPDGTGAADGPGLPELVAWMTGSFSSAEQAAADSSYLDIRLEMARIWPERTDAAWLYVEQAAAWTLDQPYRQRVYAVTQTGPDTFSSTVYELPDPAAVVGAFREPARFAALDPAGLDLRSGCTITLRREDDAFVGSTNGTDCASSLRGASYATSEVRITQHGLVSWDRGWNETGEQVWGAVSGGYVFVKAASD